MRFNYECIVLRNGLSFYGDVPVPWHLFMYGDVIQENSFDPVTNELLAVNFFKVRKSYYTPGSMVISKMTNNLEILEYVSNL